MQFNKAQHRICKKCSHVITAGNSRTDSKGRQVHRGVSLPYSANIGCPIGDTVQKNLEIAQREINGVNIARELLSKRDAAQEGRDAARREIQPPNPYDIAIRALEDIRDHAMTGINPHTLRDSNHDNSAAYEQSWWSTKRHIFEAIKRLMIAADGWDEGWLFGSDDSNKKKEAYRDNK